MGEKARRINRKIINAGIPCASGRDRSGENLVGDREGVDQAAGQGAQLQAEDVDLFADRARLGSFQDAVLEEPSGARFEAGERVEGQEGAKGRGEIGRRGGDGRGGPLDHGPLDVGAGGGQEMRLAFEHRLGGFQAGIEPLFETAGDATKRIRPTKPMSPNCLR